LKCFFSFIPCPDVLFLTFLLPGLFPAWHQLSALAGHLVAVFEYEMQYPALRHGPAD